MDVGVRELKARLSDFIERAARGEIIRVTERGRPKAVLGPLPGRLRLEQGIAEGWIRPAAGPPARARHRFRASRPVAVMLAEDRGE
ncbi:MAG: type II toxin-antitoxin system prevent-host-death family antitoxin [Acidobacteria bacterium]|nr:type II toxin-antitoxin system prevent-host-death family antitoxin [Acidobacteriota bacterium]